MSGAGLAKEIERVTRGEWKPGPGSIYLILAELLRKGLITELTKREGNTRRYIISGKGKAELERMTKDIEGDVVRQLRVLAVCSSLAGRHELEKRVRLLAESVDLGGTLGPVES